MYLLNASSTAMMRYESIIKRRTNSLISEFSFSYISYHTNAEQSCITFRHKSIRNETKEATKKFIISFKEFKWIKSDFKKIFKL